MTTYGVIDLGTTGLTVKGRFRAFAGTVWNGTTLVTFDDAAAALGTYDVAAPDQGGGFYRVTVPAALPVGAYLLTYWNRTGGVNLLIGAEPGPVFWNGTALVQFHTPAEAAGRPGDLAAMMRRVFEWTSNRKTRSRATGAKVVYGTDGTTALETQTQSTAASVDQETQGA